jgi:hypothetical protein
MVLRNAGLTSVAIVAAPSMMTPTCPGPARGNGTTRQWRGRNRREIGGQQESGRRETVAFTICPLHFFLQSRAR